MFSPIWAYFFHQPILHTRPPYPQSLTGSVTILETFPQSRRALPNIASPLIEKNIASPTIQKKKKHRPLARLKPYPSAPAAASPPSSSLRSALPHLPPAPPRPHPRARAQPSCTCRRLAPILEPAPLHPQSPQSSCLRRDGGGRLSAECRSRRGGKSPMWRDDRQRIPWRQRDETGTAGGAIVNVPLRTPPSPLHPRRPNPSSRNHPSYMGPGRALAAGKSTGTRFMEGAVFSAAISWPSFSTTLGERADNKGQATASAGGDMLPFETPGAAKPLWVTEETDEPPTYSKILMLDGDSGYSEG
ncbi:hypothetical protein BS78_02G196300 [Paspalum vaginatum]|nr:hypothetical protein BS78_02G196300 [Paspalum vaginatum]